jgi:metal-responsive CopG/Arc/MetJ family transcriptional regulator
MSRMTFAEVGQNVQRLQARHRIKVSVTIDPGLLKIVDAFVAAHPGTDRSGVFNDALLLWCGEQQERAIAEQHRAPKSEVEQTEREAWHRLQAEAVDRITSER